MDALLQSCQQALAARRFEGAEKALFAVLDGLRVRAWQPNERQLFLCTVETATKCLTDLLSSAGYAIGQAAYSQYFFHKNTIGSLFRESAFRGASHIWRRLGVAPDAGLGALDTQTRLKLLVALSVNEVPRPLLMAVATMSPWYRAVTAMGFLLEEIWRSDDAEERQAFLLGQLARDEVWSLERMPTGMVLAAWMKTSYFAHGDKHAAKAVLNKRLRDWITRDGAFGDATPRRKGKAKPTVVVVAERYNQVHAMHRCYGPSIKALRDHFKVVLMLADGDSGQGLEDFADVLDKAPFEHKKLGAYVDRIRSHEPDILYYPSVGMRLASVMLANLRLAPIQIATNGHPATTTSDEVDYMILVDEVFGGKECFTETVLLRPKGRHYLMRADAPDVAPDIRRNPDTVRIAVPAWSKKLTPGFLAACQEIAERTTRPIEFLFFPNLAGLELIAWQNYLKSILPARVYLRSDYKTYIERLNSCDIHLSTFPFGSANGIVDSARQGLPMINMIGKEPHARIDANLVNRMGQPAWLTASSREDYVQAVLRLIDDDRARVAISEAILASDPDAQVLVDEGQATPEFAEMFRQVYAHHEAMQSSERGVWPFADLMALGQAPK